MHVCRKKNQGISQLRKLLGVTLLEIMLVLAIAALIIVMSVRYFQSASISQQAVAFTSQLQAIAAAENSLSQGVGAYVNSSSLTNILPAGGLTAPWGGSVHVAASTGTFTVTTENKVQAGVCTLVKSQLLSTQGGGSWSVSGASTGAVDCNATFYLYPSSAS